MCCVLDICIMFLRHVLSFRQKCCVFALVGHCNLLVDVFIYGGTFTAIEGQLCTFLQLTSTSDPS